MCKSELGGVGRPPRPTELAAGLLMAASRERWAVVAVNAVQFADPLLQSIPVLQHARAHDSGPWEEPIPFVPLVPPVQRRSGNAYGGLHQFSPSKAVGSGCRPLSYAAR